MFVSDFINFVYDGDLTIKVYNILGQEIINTNDKLIDLRNYNDGVFIFKIWDFINQKSKSITIIKKWNIYY